MNRFEWAIRANYATKHLMHENGDKEVLPFEMYIGKGYELQMDNPKKWNAIQELYQLEIARDLKRGAWDGRKFKFKELPE